MLRLCLVTTLLCWSLPAHASGVDAPQIGTNLSGPTVADGAAVYHNPALLGDLTRPELMLGASGIFGRLGYTRERRGTYPFADGLVFQDPVDESDLDPTKTGPAEPVKADILAATADLFAAGPIRNTPVGLGGGVYVPYAAPLELPYDGAQRWALQEAFIAVAEASLGLGVQVHPRVSLGATGSYVFGFAELARSQDLGSLDLMADLLGNPPINQDNDFGPEAPTSLREQDVLSRDFRLRRATAHTGSFKVGIHARPIDIMRLGFVYDFGGTLNFRGPAQMDLDDPFFTEDLAGRGVAFPRLVEGRGTLTLKIPMRLRGAIGIDVSDRVALDLVAEGALWSSLTSFDVELVSEDLVLPELGQGDTTVVSIPRNWRNAVHVELRTTVRVAEHALVAATVGYHSPATPDATIDVASPDGHRLVGALTGAVTVGKRKRLTILPDVEVQGIVPRTVTSSDNDLGNGTYRLWLLAAGLRARVQFGAGDAGHSGSP